MGSKFKRAVAYFLPAPCLSHLIFANQHPHRNEISIRSSKPLGLQFSTFYLTRSVRSKIPLIVCARWVKLLSQVAHAKIRNFRYDHWVKTAAATSGQSRPSGPSWLSFTQLMRRRKLGHWTSTISHRVRGCIDWNAQSTQRQLYAQPPIRLYTKN